MLETASHIVERKVKNRIIDEKRKAKIFCNLMLHENLPRKMKAMALEKLQEWSVLDEKKYNAETLNNYDLYRKIILHAKNSIAETENFAQIFNLSPWNFESLEFEYEQDEINSIPYSSDLRNTLGNNIKFLLRVQAGFFHIPLIQSENGKKQVFRTVETSRAIANISEDIKNKPDLLPSFEIISLGNTKVGILIDWVSGHPPISDSEKEACLDAAQELLVIDPGNRSYDLYAGNFVISDEQSNKIYYIDGHIFESLVSRGLDPKNAENRRHKFEINKSIMN